MNKLQILPALCAGFFMSAHVVDAANQPLPTPPSSGYDDTESATNVSLLAWRDYEPRATLTLALNATPSNAVQVAFGYDRDHNADLAPEETELVLGCDCGVWFTRDERTTPPTTNYQPPTTSYQPPDHSFSLTLPKDPADRWDLAKVTTRGKGDARASIVAELVKPHFFIVIK